MISFHQKVCTQIARFFMQISKNCVYTVSSYRPKYHLRQLDVDIPVTLHSAATNTDGRTYHRERDHGVQGQNALSHNTIENARIDQNDTSKLEWLNQYNGTIFVALISKIMIMHGSSRSDMFSSTTSLL